jgi:hypothetical protein
MVPLANVNRSGPGTSSAANQRSYIAMGHLHGPLCKPPLRCYLQVQKLTCIIRVWLIYYEMQ